MNCPKCGIKLKHLIGKANGEYRCADCATVVANSEEEALRLLKPPRMALELPRRLSPITAIRQLLYRCPAIHRYR